MKWFKHFTDEHRGRSITDLMDRMGHMGLCFFLLEEICAEKLEVKGDEELKPEHCVFKFNTRKVRRLLGISQRNLERLLDICQTNERLSFSFVENELEISMPNLLNLLDRDCKKARPHRAKGALRSRSREEKEVEVEVEVSPPTQVSLSTQNFVVDESAKKMRDSMHTTNQSKNFNQDFAMTPESLSFLALLREPGINLNHVQFQGHTHRLKEVFQTPESLRDWIIEKSNNPKVASMTKGNAKNYVTISLLREIGARQ